MNSAEEAKFYHLFEVYQQGMKLHGLRDRTIESYSRTLRRVASYFLISEKAPQPPEKRLEWYMCTTWRPHGNESNPEMREGS